ncbi:MAG: hypothetical protein EZS28_008725 [Streblomastix strix]|uniref:Uncharacterized protein n=1 Tax=Streblomastix strix TaxID=222440 RepID=A0A5J4WM96_9EUKA|nr:MAG: hypothetical protein EZS28_008725 [Streblomastix strix]
MKIPTIPEAELQLEKKNEEVATVVSVASQIDPFQQPFQQQVIKCETSSLSASRRNSIIEQTQTPDPSLCRWLLDILSEDEHMVVAYTFDVPESQIQLSIEDEGCVGRWRFTYMLDVVLNHDQVLYGSTRYNAIDLINEVKNIESLNGYNYY